MLPADQSKTDRVHPQKRKVWPAIIFPAIFLLLAAACVYLILTLLGILDFGDQQTPEELPVPATEETGPNEAAKIGTQTPPATPDVEPTPEAASTLPETDLPVPVPLKHDPLDIKKPGEISSDLPDITKKEQAVPDKNEEFNRNTARIAEAGGILKRFLSARTLEERKPFISRSSRSEEELAKTCLASPFPKSSEPRSLKIMAREKDRSFEVYFSVAFADSDQEMTRIIYVRMIAFSDDEPPKIHVDPFIDLFDRTIESFASKPSKGTKTVHSLITYNAYCFDNDVPRSSTMAKVTFYPNIAPGSRNALATAYLRKNSITFAQLKEMGSGGTTHIPCTLTVAWDTEKDPQKPYLEVIRIQSPNWKL